MFAAMTFFDDPRFSGTSASYAGLMTYGPAKPRHTAMNMPPTICGVMGTTPSIMSTANRRRRTATTPAMYTCLPFRPNAKASVTRSGHTRSDESIAPLIIRKQAPRAQPGRDGFGRGAAGPLSVFDLADQERPSGLHRGSEDTARSADFVGDVRVKAGCCRLVEILTRELASEELHVLDGLDAVLTPVWATVLWPEPARPLHHHRQRRSHAIISQLARSAQLPDRKSRPPTRRARPR